MRLSDLTEKELLHIQTSPTKELKARGVVRTQNSPLSDYMEWRIARAPDLELQANSKAGYDGVSKDSVRIQIKGRRVTPTNHSRQLTANRKYAEKDFDALAVVVYDQHLNTAEALLIPREVVGEYAS